MRWAEVRWGRVIGLAGLAEVLLVLASILYMVIYGFFYPGHPEEFYQQHVRVAGPWISIVAGMPIFFLFARWLARDSVVAALAFFAIWAALDNSILVAIDGASGIWRIFPLWAASHATKLLSVWAGARFR